MGSCRRSLVVTVISSPGCGVCGTVILGTGFRVLWQSVRPQGLPQLLGVQHASGLSDLQDLHENLADALLWEVAAASVLILNSPTPAASSTPAATESPHPLELAPRHQ